MTDDRDAQPLTGEVHDGQASTTAVTGGALVEQPHGGAIQRGKPARVRTPTAADVAADAQVALYRLLPRLKRIARNEATRPKRKRAKKGETDKRHRGRRLFPVAEQLRAFSTLKEIAMLDKTVRASDVDEFLRGIVEDVRGFLPPDQGDALLAMIGRRALKL